MLVCRIRIDSQTTNRDMKVISILNQKGGVGKTTLAVNLAAYLSGERKKTEEVVLIDADPQGSALDWYGARGERPAPFMVVGYPKANLHITVSEIGKHSAYVVIDGAPRVTELSRSAIMASDLIIIPVQPSPYDIWASSDIIKLIREARIYKPEIQTALLISRRIANTAIGRDVTQVLSGFDLPVFESKLSQRVIFAESASAGLSVFEQDPRSAAAGEMRAVGEEVLRFLKEHAA